MGGSKPSKRIRPPKVGGYRGQDQNRRLSLKPLRPLLAGVHGSITTEDLRRERRLRRLTAKIDKTKQAKLEKEIQEGKLDDEIRQKRQQVIDKLAGRLAELENWNWAKDERLRLLDANREEALRQQRKRLEQVVGEKAELEIDCKRMLASVHKRPPPTPKEELTTFTYHVAEFNRAWYTLPTETGKPYPGGHPVCEFHCRQILNRNKNKKSEV